MEKRNKKKILIIGIVVLAIIGAAIAAAGWHTSQTQDIFAYDDLKNDMVIDSGDYQLEQVLIVSRHNIRSPLSGGDSLLGQITPHEWFAWTSPAGELSVKGGQLETAMGQFFRKYEEAKGFIPVNWQPQEGEIRFFSNSLQRTVATARFFAGGFLPAADVTVEHHNPLGESDFLFCPVIRYITPAFEKQVREEIAAMGGEDGMVGIGRKLQGAYDRLETVLDFKDSRYAKENGLSHIPTDDTAIELTAGEEVILTGGLKTANSAIDALKLQLYEQQNLNKALFGHTMSEEDIKAMCEIGDVYQQVCEGSKTLASQVMTPFITEMKREFNTDGRKFTFLCGHDSTLAGLAAALEIKHYELPGAVSCKTPIGAKLMFEKYSGKDGKAYIRVYMCYQTTAQLRGGNILSLEQPPMFYALEFEGMEKNADGYYLFEDVIARFDEVIDRYDDYLDDSMKPAA